MRLLWQILNPFRGRLKPQQHYLNCWRHASTLAASSPSSPANRAYIAFGSNVGDRVAMIEEALRAMARRSINVARTSSLWETEPMYVTDQGRFLNGVCEIDTNLSPMSLLDTLQEIESNMGRQKTVPKGPRNIDLDILLYGKEVVDSARLVVPHPLMLEREFVLRPLCELIPQESLPSQPSICLDEHLHALPAGSGSSMSTITPLATRIPPIRALAHDRATHLMAILNVTPDSFSDGGQHFRSSAQEIGATAAACLGAGASIIDIGGQSTRPGAEDVGLDEELRRAIAPIRKLRDTFSPDELCISVDTYRASVAREAIAAGADMVNDISGGQMDPAMFSTVAELGCTLVIMHTRGTPATMSTLSDYPAGVIPTVAEELRGRVKAAEAAGIRRWRIVIDPGIGFAKAQAHNLELLRRLPEVRQAPGLRGLPMLVGPSRKGFIGRITGVREAEQRIWGTAAAVSAAVAGGADIVRVHDVAEMNKVVKMADAIWRG